MKTFANYRIIPDQQHLLTNQILVTLLGAYERHANAKLEAGVTPLVAFATAKSRIGKSFDPSLFVLLKPGRSHGSE